LIVDLSTRRKTTGVAEIVLRQQAASWSNQARQEPYRRRQLAIGEVIKNVRADHEVEFALRLFNRKGEPVNANVRFVPQSLSGAIHGNLRDVSSDNLITDIGKLLREAADRTANLKCPSVAAPIKCLKHVGEFAGLVGVAVEAKWIVFLGVKLFEGSNSKTAPTPPAPQWRTSLYEKACETNRAHIVSTSVFFNFLALGQLSQLDDVSQLSLNMQPSSE
jgi:hypothetical protein